VLRHVLGRSEADLAAWFNLYIFTAFTLNIFLDVTLLSCTHWGQIMSAKEEQWILHSLFLINLIEASLQNIVGSELRYHVEAEY
jgi:hypothetical protein